MSTNNLKIAVYENLPTGGAKSLYEENLKFLKNKYKIIQLKEIKISKYNLIKHMYYVLFKLPPIHKKLALQANKCDVMITYHSWITKSPHILRYTKIPKIYICHEPPREYYDEEQMKLQSFKERLINILRFPIKLIDRNNVISSSIKIATNSKFSKRIIASTYRKNSTVIYPGINIKEFSTIRVRKKRNQVISVGAINKLKRYDFLINVVGLIDRVERPELIIIGNGSNKDYLQSIKFLAKSREVILKVKININKADLIKEYQKSLCFLYAPVSEPFGIVVLEAMASGLPVVSYKCGGGYTEILNNKNGVLIDNLDEKYWADKIYKLLTDSNRMDCVSKGNLKYAKNYSREKMNMQLLKLIKSL